MGAKNKYTSPVYKEEEKKLKKRPVKNSDTPTQPGRKKKRENEPRSVEKGKCFKYDDDCGSIALQGRSIGSVKWWVRERERERERESV